MVNKSRRLVKNNDFTPINKAFETEKFSELLEEAYVGIGRESKFTKKTSFAPSSFGYNGNCPRYWYYAFNGAEFVYTTDALAQANMEYGTEAGKRIARLLDKAGILVDDEIPVKHDDPPIGGYMDAMVRWQGEEMVCEVKTTRQESWSMRQAAMKAPGYQLIQLLIYMKVFNKKKGFFLVENKNTGEWLIIPIKMNEVYENLIEGVFEWMRRVHKNALEGELPKRPFETKSNPVCKSCPVVDTCWEGFKKQTQTRELQDPNPGTVDLPLLELPK